MRSGFSVMGGGHGHSGLVILMEMLRGNLERQEGIGTTGLGVLRDVDSRPRRLPGALLSLNLISIDYIGRLLDAFWCRRPWLWW